MKYAYDLHIHSVLSPCADILMTPNNILNMAMLNNLDFISVTDHNSLKQLKIIKEISESYEFILIYGVEVQVEKAHILCYFKDFETVLKFDQYLENKLIKKQYDIDLLGEQIITNEYDEEISRFNYYLINNIDVKFKEFLEYVNTLSGVIVLSHVDRNKYSAIDLVDESTVKLIDAIEITPKTNEQEFKKHYPIIKDKFVMRNSDAHSIINLSERKNFIDLEEKSVDAFFKFFGK